MVLEEILFIAQEQLLKGRVREAMEDLVKSLHHIRSSISPERWQEAIAACRQHPICSYLHQDPFTERSFLKPRGYAGDASMLDMIYDHDRPPGSCDNLGRSIYSYTAGSGRAPQGVRYRRSVIARLVDEAAQRQDSLRVLSIACGHLREVELSAAFKEGCVEEWVGLDQDADSVAKCLQLYAGTAIRPVTGSVRQILSGKLPFRNFDLVYTAGLFDYLSPKTARALVSRMVGMLKPGGKLMVANFMDGFLDAGYMEAFMDWTLIYRTQNELRHLFPSVGKQQDFAIQTFSDPYNAIVYATAERK